MSLGEIGRKKIIIPDMMHKGLFGICLIEGLLLYHYLSCDRYGRLLTNIQIDTSQFICIRDRDGGRKDKEAPHVSLSNHAPFHELHCKNV